MLYSCTHMAIVGVKGLTVAISGGTELPVFVRELSSQTAVVGDTVQFTVSVNASPPASLTWLINGFTLSRMSH